MTTDGWRRADTRDPMDGEGGQATGVEDEVRRRYLNFLDYLEELFRKQHPPVRDIATYRDYRLRETDAPFGTGVRFAPSGSVWLAVTLVPLPTTPQLPVDLVGVVESADIDAQEPPTLREDAFIESGLLDETARELANQDLESWNEDTWLPWAVARQAAERGRGTYKELHRLRDRLEHDSDVFELVWSFGRVRWRHAAGLIDHPLLSVPVEIELDRAGGRLEVRPIGPPMVEEAFLSDIELADRSGYRQERDQIEDAQVEVWDRDARDEIFQRLLRSIDHDGVVVESPSSPLGPTAILRDEWVLYCRRRQSDYLGFLDAQRDLYRTGLATIPPTVASLVADHSLVAAVDGTGGQGGADVQLLLPLAANEEQYHILERAQRSSGVTVQGPPGTGKSHTIANLISHYVAYGKRVLVTAEKEQPLSVLRDKLPAEVRTLAIAALGSDVANQARVEQSITAIQEAVHHASTSRLPEEIQRLSDELDSVGRSIAVTTQELRARHQFEVESCPPSVGVAGTPSPSDLGKWLHAYEPALGYIPDRVAPGSSPPLTVQQLVVLVQILRTVAPADLTAAAEHLPPVKLPSSSLLAENDAEMARLGQQSATAGITDWSRIDDATQEEINDLAAAVAHAVEQCAKVAGTWLAVVRDELRSATVASSWQAFADETRQDWQAALSYGLTLQAHVVTLPVEGPPAASTMQALREARERLVAGKGIGRLAPRTVRQVLAQCRVDGDDVTTPETVDLCLAEADLRGVRQRIVTRWANQTSRVSAPPLPAEQPEHGELVRLLGGLDGVLVWAADGWPDLRERVGALGIATEAHGDDDELARTQAGVEAAVARRQAQERMAYRERIARYLEDGRHHENASGLWARLSAAFETSNWVEWDRACGEVARIHALGPQAAQFAELHGRLARAAPVWAADIVQTRGETVGDPSDLPAAWRWRAADTWLQEQLAGPSVAELQRRLEDLTQTRLKCTEKLVGARAWYELGRSFGDRQNRALEHFIQASKRLGKGTGKYAPRWRREIRQAIDTAKDAIPVWIVPATRVLESFRPAEKPPFDVLIVDEASQVPLTAAPILGLADRVIVVGDDEQTSPENVGLDQEPVHRLLDRYLPEIPDRRTVFDVNASLYGLASARFHEGKIVLKEHFRCLPEIIEFSNQRYYGRRLVPLRDSLPGWQPLGTIHVQDGFRHANTDTNEPEAQAIAELVAELVDDPLYVGKSIGIVSLLGAKQAPLIHDLLLDRIGQTEFEQRRIRCGEPPNFQGDERDIMILSLVVAPDEFGSLRVGAMTRKPQERRVNVAASRARDQMWLVHSVPAAELPNGDPRRELLRHCTDPQNLTTTLDDLEKHCESEFERQVLRRILARGYRRVLVQHVVGRYRIDIVIEGFDGESLAVECDGDAFHNIETWEEDRARQAVLERAGWTFERIAGSAFFRDPDAALEPLWRRLTELGIGTGDPEPAVASTSVHRVVTIGSAAHSREPAAIPAEAVQPDSLEDPLPEARPPLLVTGGVAAHEAPMSERPIEQEHRDRRAPDDTATVNQAESPSFIHTPRRTGHQPDRGHLPPYSVWPAESVSSIASTPLRLVIDVLVEIVEQEGPVLADRAYRIYHQAAGGHRVGKDIREKLDQARRSAIGAGRLAELKDGDGSTTLYLPGTEPIVVRARGARDLYEIPRSEITALADQLEIRHIPLPDAKREILDAYGLVRMTEKASAYLAECLNSARPGLY